MDKVCNFLFSSKLAYVYVLIFFITAYTLYQLVFLACRKLARKKSVYIKLAAALHYPVLLLFFEIAALFSVQMLNLPERVTRNANHALNILIIATLGWILIALLRAFYLNFTERYAEAIKTDISRRSLLTQMLFLYRFLQFVICAVTLAVVFMTFPYIKNVGMGILGSAGIAGIVLGVAAKPILLNIMVGFQIAFTKIIKIGDAIFIEGEFARVEAIHLTRVVVCTWDLRRIVLPIAYFIDKPFQNWDLTSPELLSSVYLYCDYTVPLDAVRKKAEEIITNHPNWNRKIWNVQVTSCNDKAMEIRVAASANDASASFDLRSSIREKLIVFLQKEYPSSLPLVRNYQISAEKA